MEVRLWHNADVPSRVSRPDSAPLKKLLQRALPGGPAEQTGSAMAELLHASVNLEGEELLADLALQFTRLLGVDICLINQVDPERKGWLKTVGAARAGSCIEDLHYPVEGTPCEIVLQGQVVHVASELGTAFPKDQPAIDEGWVSYYGVPLWNEAREVIGEICILDYDPIEDTSAPCELLQFFAERAAKELTSFQLQESQRRAARDLSAFAAELPGWLCAYRTADGGRKRDLLYTNQHGAELLGPRHFAEIQQDLTAFNELIHPEDRTRVEEIYTLARDTESKFSTEYRIRHDSGTYRWVHAHGRFSQLDEEYRICHSVMLDFERVRSLEVERSNLTRELRTLVSAIPDAVFLQDALGRIKFINHAAESLLGLQASQMIGANFRTLAQQHPELAVVFDRAADNTDRCLRSLEQMTTRVRRTLPDSEQERDFETRRLPLFDAAGAPTGLVTLVRDLTRELESQRQSQANERERTRLAAQARLVDKVAHEFENQLTAVLGYNSLIDQRLSDQASGLDPWMRKALDGIRAAGQTASDLARGLLVFGRSSRPADLAHCDPEEVLRAAEPVLRATIGEDIQFRLSTEGPAPLRDLNLGQAGFASILFELARNARDACAAGDRIEFVAQTAASYENGEVGFRLVVRDTGCGLPEHALAQLFEPMADKTESAGPGGRGMGLALIRARVDQAGGKIRVESAAEVGTTFVIDLPYCPRPRESLRASSSAQQLRVLALDDKQAMRDLLKEILEAGNYQVELACNCADLRARMHELEPPDIVLLDIHLEDGLGIDLVDEIRTLWPQAALVFCSGLPRASLIAHDIHLPDDCQLVSKPFRPTQLLAALASAAV